MRYVGVGVDPAIEARIWWGFSGWSILVCRILFRTCIAKIPHVG